MVTLKADGTFTMCGPNGLIKKIHYEETISETKNPEEENISCDPNSDLNVDPALPHHYIIGVAMRDMKSANAGKIFLKYGPVYFTNADVEKVQNASLLSVDKIFKTTSKEASEAYGCSEIIMALHGLKLASQSNSATVHHFSSQFKIPDYWNWFAIYVNNANKSSSIKEQLLNARIKNY